MSNNPFAAPATPVATPDPAPVTPQTQTTPNPQAQPAPNSPAGDVFGTNPGNNPPHGDPSQIKDGNNNSAESLALQLTSGVLLNKAKAAPTTEDNQPKPLVDAEGKPTTKEALVISELAKNYKGESLLGEFNEEAILKGFLDGDLTELQNSLEQSMVNGYNRAMDSFLKLIPDIITAAEAKALESVSEINQGESLWSNFVAVNPEFADSRAIVEPQLKLAIENGSTPQQAAGAMKIIFGGGLKKPNENDKTDQVFKSKGSRFSIADL